MLSERQLYHEGLIDVLILVVMEYALGVQTAGKSRAADISVLILVVMEYALGERLAQQ